MNKILIVDDEEAIQRLYSDEFTEEGLPSRIKQSVK
jgi:DNA-binding NtrC family response regulator